MLNAEFILIKPWLWNTETERAPDSTVRSDSYPAVV